MKSIIVIFILISFTSFSQIPKEFETEIEMNFDFGIRAQNDWKLRAQVIKALGAETKKWDDLTKKELRLFEKYDETYNSMWDTAGGGCDWYCGAGGYTMNASTYLKSQNENSYNVDNIGDFSYQTAWVEGVPGYGIGEFIEFVFQPEHPRLTLIKIANGYIKSKQSWQNNSRVKKLKMFVNDEFYGIINLKDVYSLQSVTLESPIGNSEREDFEKLKEFPEWKIKFEILEVYKGDKYDDTAITEIFFDGIDVH